MPGEHAARIPAGYQRQAGQMHSRDSRHRRAKGGSPLAERNRWLWWFCPPVPAHSAPATPFRKQTTAAPSPQLQHPRRSPAPKNQPYAALPDTPPAGIGLRQKWEGHCFHPNRVNQKRCSQKPEKERHRRSSVLPLVPTLPTSCTISLRSSSFCRISRADLRMLTKSAAPKTGAQGEGSRETVLGWTRCDSAGAAALWQRALGSSIGGSNSGGDRTIPAPHGRQWVWASHLGQNLNVAPNPGQQPESNLPAAGRHPHTHLGQTCRRRAPATWSTWSRR